MEKTGKGCKKVIMRIAGCQPTQKWKAVHNTNETVPLQTVWRQHLEEPLSYSSLLHKLSPCPAPCSSRDAGCRRGCHPSHRQLALGTSKMLLASIPDREISCLPKLCKEGVACQSPGGHPSFSWPGSPWSRKGAASTFTLVHLCHTGTAWPRVFCSHY